MRNNNKSIPAVFAFLCFISSHAVAQETFNIWPGAAPGSESWKQEEQTVKNTPVGTVVLDVVTPTLTAYLPDKSKATGTAVIIAPGGACIALAMKSTDELATSLSEKGIAAFILKYRLKEKKEQGIPKDLNEDTACQYGIADAVQSIKFVRRHASEWGISKIGILGFSAGGMIASEVVVQKDTTALPDFAAFIYGAPFASMPVIPSRLPPIFMCWAQDDEIAATTMQRFYKALILAGHKPEVHVFNAGGHAFAAKEQGTTSDHWADILYYWLQAEGFARKE